jgi:hypothetical protein
MTNTVTGRPGNVTAMPAEDRAGATPNLADLPMPAVAVPGVGGADDGSVSPSSAEDRTHAHPADPDAAAR